VVTSYGWYLGLLAALACERLLELRRSRRNARLAFAQGAREVGQGQYRAMTALHTAFLLCAALEPWVLARPFPGALGFAALGVAALAQALRAWAVSALGARWNTRVIVLPDAAPVTHGPYRYLKHPNYLAVVAELAAVPLIHGAWLTAVTFSALNAGLLAWRIRVEEAALGERWAAAFAGRSRLIPKRR
jgi:methyltransferase